jgi:hypothetical protein
VRRLQPLADAAWIGQRRNPLAQKSHQPASGLSIEFAEFL